VWYVVLVYSKLYYLSILHLHRVLCINILIVKVDESLDELLSGEIIELCELVWQVTWCCDFVVFPRSPRMTGLYVFAFRETSRLLNHNCYVQSWIFL